MSSNAVGQQFGRYRLVERIGYGGMAEVFRASYSPAPGFDKTLVVKRILPHLSEDERFVKMFRDEAAITVHLTHPNIVQVFDFGTIDGIYFLAMEYVRGRNLRQLLRKLREQNRPVPVGLAAYITAEVARGLSYAHDATDNVGRPLGIVHRDLNPPNILLSYQGGVKITDFGIAKASRRLEKTEAGRIKGKIEYTAPETLLGRDSDHRADMWALGCLLYEMITGQHPFPVSQEDALAQKIIKITQEKYIPVSDLRDGVPAPLERAVDLLLLKDPDKRPDTASEIATVASAVVPPTARGRLGDMLRDLFAAEHAVEGTPSGSVPPSGKDFSIPSEVSRVAEAASSQEAPTRLTPPPVSRGNGGGSEGIEDAIATAINEPSAPPASPPGSAQSLLDEASVATDAPPGVPDPTMYSPPPPDPRSQTPPPQPSVSSPPPQERSSSGSGRVISPQQVFDEEPPRSSKLPLILVIVLVPMVLVLAVVAYLAINPGGQTTPTQTVTDTPTDTVTVSPETVTLSPTQPPTTLPTTPPTAPPTSVPSTPPPVTLGVLAVSPSPSSARVTVNGKPYKYGQKYPAGTKLRIVVAAPGHVSWSRTARMTGQGLSFSPKLAEAGEGTLRLASKPWADVYVDGKPLGRQTPIYDLKLPAGTHRIRLVNNLEQLRMEFTVTIRANQSTTRTVDLRTKKVQ